MTRALGLLEHGQENGALGLEGCHVEGEVASFPRALLHCASISTSFLTWSRTFGREKSSQIGPAQGWDRVAEHGNGEERRLLRVVQLVDARLPNDSLVFPSELREASESGAWHD